MAYLSETSDTLTRTLERFVTLNTYQLAGQVANLDFWLAEIEHVVGIIDGYPERFQRLKTAQAAHAKRHSTVQFETAVRDPIGERPPPLRPGVPDSERKSLRKELLDTAYRFLVRCANESLIDRDALTGSLQRLGITLSTSDLH